MKKKLKYPQTRITKPEPQQDDDSWIIWAAWADRITFEEIFERTGYTEQDVILHMRKNLKASSFRLWRKRVHQTSIKHRKKFVTDRQNFKRSIQFDILGEIDEES